MYHWQFSSSIQRSKEWYIIALIIVLFLVVYGILQELYIMSIVAFLFAGVYILIENNASPVSTVDIDDKKIQVNSTIYNFDSIDRFTLLMSGGEHSMLRIFMKK
jgi:hypothetical protein